MPSLISLSGALLLSLAQSGEPEADVIFEGRVFTALPRAEGAEWAEAVAVRGKRVLAVGTRAEVARLRGDSTRVIRSTGTIVPGFNDAHCHFTVGFGAPYELDLSACTTLAELLEALGSYAAAHPELEVLEGGHWDLADMPEHAFPTAAMLDEVVDDRPVLLWSDGPHGIWANSKAMELADIEPTERFPPSILAERDADGRLTGVFRGFVFGLFSFDGPPEFDALQAGIRRGLAEARRLGVTSVHESVSPAFLPFLTELHDSGELTLRFHVWGNLQAGPFGGGPTAHLMLAKEHARDGFVTFGTLKGGVDGMPGLRTAAMIEPYADAPGSTGFRMLTLETLTRGVASAHSNDLAVALHATGDAGVRTCLEAYEENADDAQEAPRNTIEHAFFVAPEDVEWFAERAVVSVQPGFLALDLARNDVYLRRLGKERLERVMPLRSLLDAGATLAFGTDYSLTPLDPMFGLFAATTRTSRGGQPAGGFLPDERISIEEALRAYTYGSACAEGQQQEKGTLAAGMLADVVVLSHDVTTIAPTELLDVHVELTMVDGRIVYER